MKTTAAQFVPAVTFTEPFVGVVLKSVQPASGFSVTVCVPGVTFWKTARPWASVVIVWLLSKRNVKFGKAVVMRLFCASNPSLRISTQPTCGSWRFLKTTAAQLLPDCTCTTPFAGVTLKFVQPEREFSVIVCWPGVTFEKRAWPAAFVVTVWLPSRRNVKFGSDVVMRLLLLSKPSLRTSTQPTWGSHCMWTFKAWAQPTVMN